MTNRTKTTKLTGLHPPDSTERPRVALNGWLYPGKHDKLINKWNALGDDVNKSELLVRGLRLVLNAPIDIELDPVTSRLLDELSEMRRIIEGLKDQQEQTAEEMKLLRQSARFAPQSDGDWAGQAKLATAEDMERRRANRKSNNW